MGYLDQSTACDKREHDTCSGTVAVMEQDGVNHYVCKCSCHREKAAKRCKAEGHPISPTLKERCPCCEERVVYKPVAKVKRVRIR